MKKAKFMNFIKPKEYIIIILATIFINFFIINKSYAVQTYTMKEGDTLWDLAAKFYGDPRLYPIFLEVNDITNPRRIPTGKVIIVPSYNELKKIQNEPDPQKRKQMIQNLRESNTSSSLNNSSNSNITSTSAASNPNQSIDYSSYSDPIDPKQLKLKNIFEGTVKNINSSRLVDTAPAISK